MLWLVLLAAAVAAEPAPGVPLTRTVSVSVYTKKLAPVVDLKAEEVRVSEDGRERSVLGIERDRRPLEVAMVVDSGATVAASYRSDLVPAVVDFWKALPPGTPVALWSTAPAKMLVLPSARGSFGGGPSGDAVYAWDVQGYFGQIGKAYHGAYVEALSTLAVAQWLRQFAADLNGEYRVRFESEAGPEGAVKVEVRRKDTKLRVGRTGVEIGTMQ
jgi:hypothetical protein